VVTLCLRCIPVNDPAPLTCGQGLPCVLMGASSARRFVGARTVRRASTPLASGLLSMHLSRADRDRPAAGSRYRYRLAGSVSQDEHQTLGTDDQHRRLATRDRRPCRFRIRGEAAARRLFLPFDGMEQRPLRLERSGRPRVLPRCAGVVGDCSYATVVRSSSRNHSAGRSYRPWLSEGPSASNAAPVMHWWVNDGRSFSGTSPLGRKIGPGRAEVRMLAGTTLSTFRAKRVRACPRGRTPRSSVATDGTAAGDTPGSGMFGHG
jgi:hypothetical protein